MGCYQPYCWDRYRLLRYEEMVEIYSSSRDALILMPTLAEDYVFLEVPVTISYYLIDEKSWLWNLMGGLRSRFIIGSSVPLDFGDGRTKGIENPFINNVIIRLLVGYGVGYRLNPKLRLNFTPSLQYGLSPVNQHDVVDT